MLIKADKSIMLLLLVICASWECSFGVHKEVHKPGTYDFIVDRNGSGDFTTIQGALDEVIANRNERTYIYVKKGVYKEVVRVEEDKKNVALIGEGTEDVVLTYGNYASKVNPGTGKNYGTSGSSSTYIYGDGFFAKNITFENSSGPVGQALAIYVNGDEAVFVDCKFLGYQDTMYNGRSRQYFKNCDIEGSTDFIFGPATAWFDHCDLYTKGGSAITAASTEKYVSYGYVFDHCTITGTEENITTLGRPWRPYGSVTFLNTEMSNSIKPVGWDNWRDESNEETARYAEFENTGEGSDTSGRVDWITHLNTVEAAKYTIVNVFKTTYDETPVQDNWNPEVVLIKVNEFLEQLEESD